MGSTVLWIVFFCMLAGTVIFAVTARATSFRFRALHVNNFLICATAMVAYLAMATNIGTTVVHSDPKNRSNWREVFYARCVVVRIVAEELYTILADAICPICFLLATSTGPSRHPCYFST